ncbi:MAG: hypothetical protein GY796_34970, partial [Chloroflexi bacterium]|nr:hypothetical protein [Chloroflexota bacterium]
AVRRQALTAQNVNWINGEVPREPIPVQIKIRYKAKLVDGSVVGLEDGRAHCTFLEPVFGVTAGQAAVFYVGNTVIGGGIISEGYFPGN